MNAQENSDESIVPAKSANNDGTEPALESIEERDSAKRNDVQADLLRTQNRDNRKSSGLHGVRENVAVSIEGHHGRAVAFAPDSRQEPYEVILHVRICAGGGWQQPSLPRCAPG